MDDDVYAFLEKWIEDNVAPTDASLRAERAENLAAECYKEAGEAGFSEEEVDEAADELSEGAGLAAYIEAALDKAEEEEEVEED